MDERLKIPDSWTNIGDSNPERNGGIFVKWEDFYGGWRIIVTTHFADISDGISENEHMFEHMLMNPSDMWKDPNYVTEGMEEWAIETLKSLSNPPFQIETLNDPSLIPENESFEDNYDWILNNHSEWLVNNCASGFVARYGSEETEFYEDYWSYLSDYGVDPEDF